MPDIDKRIDEYIDRSKEFAKPVLRHIRSLVHQACPDVSETIKWGMPHFEYKGILCSMAAFKEHCSLTFWKGSLMKDPYDIMDKKREHAMGQFGRIKSKADLPADRILIQYIREAMQLNIDGLKVPSRSQREKKKELEVPSWFLSELGKNSKARDCFNKLSAAHKREYLDWIMEAKKEETRQRRLDTTLEWLSQGKSFNWKYE